MGLRSIEVECDSSSLASLLSSNSLPLSNVGSLFKDIRSLGRDIEVISISFQPRKYNGVAHRLAQFGLSLDLESRWIDFVPSIIEDVILEDTF